MINQNWISQEELETDQMALSGIGSPAKTLGEIGQFYIDRSTGDLYEKVKVKLGPLRTDYHLRSLILILQHHLFKQLQLVLIVMVVDLITGAKQLYVCINSKFAKASSTATDVKKLIREGDIAKSGMINSFVFDGTNWSRDSMSIVGVWVMLLIVQVEIG